MTGVIPGVFVGATGMMRLCRWHPAPPQPNLITGGSERIGRAIAARLVKTANTTVIISGHDTAKGAITAQELGCAFLPCYVTDYHSVKQMINQIARDHGPVSTLVNNARLWTQGPLDSNDPIRMHDIILSNTLGLLNVARAVLLAMKQAQAGGEVLGDPADIPRHRALRFVYR